MHSVFLRRKCSILTIIGVILTFCLLEFLYNNIAQILLKSNRENFDKNVNAAMKYLAVAQRFERNQAKHESLKKITESLSQIYNLQQSSLSLKEVTVLVDCIQEPISLDQIIQELSKSSNKPFVKNIRILIGVRYSSYIKHKAGMVDLLKSLPNLKIVFLEKYEKSAVKMMRNFVGHVETPFIMFSRSFNVFDKVYSNIDKLIVPLKLGTFDVVGGTIYNKLKGWNVGCNQMNLIWYQLKIQKGYDVKNNGYYAQCDFIEGPFATKTSLLIEYFNSWSVSEFAHEDNIMASHYLSKYEKIELSIDLVYVDFFHFMKENLKKIDVCLDCLFSEMKVDHLEDEKYMRIFRSHWQSFGEKNGISEIIVQPNLVEENQKHHIFSCKEINLICHRRKKDMFVERCCMRNLHNLLMDAYRIFDKYGMEYASSDGTALGSIKILSTLPWDLDHDFEFRTGNFSEVVKREHEFLQNDMILKKEFDDPCMENPTERFTCGYVAFKSKGWRIEAWGQYLLMSDLHEAYKIPVRNKGILPENRIQGTATYTEMEGHWSRARPNPGLYARASYGLDVLRHAKHWILSAKESSHSSYQTSSTFGPCTKEGFHGCMNRYVSDGNIQFQRPWA